MIRLPRRGGPLRLVTVLALVLDAMVVAVDVLTPDYDMPIAPLAIAPLLPAIVGLLSATVALAALSLVLAIAMTGVHGAIGETDDLIRLVTVAVVEALAIAGVRLRRRLDELAQALDALPDAVTIQGAGGAVLYGNRAAQRLGSGRGRLDREAAAAYLGRMIVTDASGAPLDPEEMPARRLIAGREAQPVVVRSMDPATGEVTWSRVQASPLEDAEGRVRSAVNVIEDITEVQETARRAAFLARAGSLLGASLDIAATLQATADLVVPDLADWCTVDLVVPGGRVELAALAHADPEKAALGHRLRARYPPDLARADGLGAVLRSGEPLLLTDITPEQLEAGAVDAEHLAILREIGFSSALVVPLRIGPRVIGALTWVAAESRRRYGPTDLETATALAARVAVAVENARVHTARVEIATVLQEALLPTALPAVPGWALAAHYRAAGEANEVGGDFYDVVVLEDGTVLALVGDVAGKGARAAALTARTRHTLVTAAALGGGDPTAGLTLLNAALQREDGLELCSVAAVVLRGAEATVLSAGHPRPLLVRDGALTELGTPSPMLGAAPEEQAWRTTRHALRPGDLLVLHTDGVTDAVGREARFGDARLRDALLAGPAEAQAAIDRVTAHLDAFEHGPQADDRALLALERRR